jgi:hypothetical protein
MSNFGKPLCPYLRGSNDGAKCCAADDFIRNIENITLKMCMSSHYEGCYVYISWLMKGGYSSSCPLGSTP